MLIVVRMNSFWFSR